MLIQIIIFIFGLMIGSFLNVVIYRIPNEQSITFGRSYCPNCETQLKYYDLIPVVSFLWTTGQCRYCEEKISWQYPVVELLTAFLFLGLYLKFSLTVKLGVLMLLISLLIASSIIDLQLQIIPNKITYFGIIIGLIFSLIFNYISIKLALLGLLIPAGFLLLIAVITKGGMGIGDVKFAAMIGTFIGPKLTLLGIFLGSLLGSIIALFLLLAGKKTRKSKLPFGPLIALGTIIMIFYGQVIIDWYLRLIM
ncbi:prepilin peptidase [Halanaerobacter jeridensis]|uniref:Leader peptidase (Prepilin peptidase)/N-methyltransferase n=1 Tax=Halanaerobacter jeridensis TaxID=706427 RepID=A0A938XQF2_9FIRM|nr:A24 family peptidase [Halanaerobacter jeridensis]MBM7557953.1 leader peptidase (prepilin peptidase)/N-methyltransferase [Halanaerobacter jeridensis]